MTPLPASDKWFTESQSDSSGSSNGTMSWQNSHLLDNQDSLTLLIVGTASGKVRLYVFGYVQCATIYLAETVSIAGAVLDAQCSSDMNLLSVIVEKISEDETEAVHVTCDMAVIAEHHCEIYLLSRKVAEIQALINYATDATNQLREAWEGILLEMDTKLDAYSGAKGEGEVSADFLDLLVFGYASPEFHMFIGTKLSEKGLKKLRQTVEMGYTNMHKLVVKQLEAVGQGLVFVISQMLGMARRTDQYGMLGVEEAVVSQALKEAGAFLLKTGELQQVIGLSMRNFLAFLRWLSVVHLRINGCTVFQDLCKSTQQETNHVLSFLNDTLEEVVVDKDGKRHRKFRLEGVGQYLCDEPLKTPLPTDNNPWLQFLEAHPQLKDHTLMLPPRRDFSLVQSYNSLAQELVKLSEASVEAIGKNIRVSKCISLLKTSGKSDLIVSQRSYLDSHKMHVVVVPPLSPFQINVFEWSTDLNDVYRLVTDESSNSKITVGSFYFTCRNALATSSLDTSRSSTGSTTERSAARIIGAQFYSSEYLSVLTQDFNNAMRCLFVQVPVSKLREKLNTKLTFSPNIKIYNEISTPPAIRQAEAEFEESSSSMESPEGNLPTNPHNRFVLRSPSDDDAAAGSSASSSPPSAVVSSDPPSAVVSSDPPSAPGSLPSNPEMGSDLPEKKFSCVPVDMSAELQASDVFGLEVSGGVFAVSGERKVAAVVAAHRRTVVLFEIEVDDDDEEDETTEVEEEAPVPADQSK